MNSAEKLRLLRRRMQEQGMDAYVVVTDDFHGSEYVGDYFKAREYLSGFTGSAGTLVVLPDSAALWTDGRYFLQAADQLAGSTIDLMRAGQPGVPTIGAFLAQRVPQGGIVGFDGRTVSSLFARTMAAALEGKNVRFAYEQDLAGAVWPDRPALSAQPVWELPAECAGLTREEKLRLLREKMRETGAEVLVLTALDEVAWTLNLRGDDVRCTPVFLSFLLLRQEEATLCVQEQILSGELKEKLAACGVALAPYESIYDRLRAIPAGAAVQTDSATANYCVLQSLSGAKVLDRPSPVQLMKAMKTPAEQETLRDESQALSRAFRHYDELGLKGIPKEEMMEKVENALLAAFRKENNGNENVRIKLDPEKNKIRGEEVCISTDDSKVKVWVIPTNEELMIAQDTAALCK